MRPAGHHPEYGDGRWRWPTTSIAIKASRFEANGGGATGPICRCRFAEQAAGLKVTPRISSLLACIRCWGGCLSRQDRVGAEHILPATTCGKRRFFGDPTHRKTVLLAEIPSYRRRDALGFPLFPPSGRRVQRCGAPNSFGRSGAQPVQQRVRFFARLKTVFRLEHRSCGIAIAGVTATRTGAAVFFPPALIARRGDTRRKKLW